jgi:integrase/recombinase XerD
MVLKPNGQLGTQLFVAAGIAKNNVARRIPLHPELGRALSTLHQHAGRPRTGPVIQSERGAHMTPRSIVNWFAATYAALGLDGCSSHSGRRTFITRSARLLTRSGGSLRDVQELAGHKRLTTTECYIEGDRDAQRRLIRLV